MRKIFQKFIYNKDRAISLAAFIISIVAIIQTSGTLKLQRKHNYLSVKPIPIVSIQNYDNLIGVKLHNAGIGPLIISDFSVVDINKHIKNNLIDFMPLLPDSIFWSDYRKNIDDATITPNSSYDLLLFIGNVNSAMFIKYRDSIKTILKDLSIELEYTDVYNNDFDVKYWNLKGFKRIKTSANIK